MNFFLNNNFKQGTSPMDNKESQNLYDGSINKIRNSSHLPNVWRKFDIWLLKLNICDKNGIHKLNMKFNVREKIYKKLKWKLYSLQMYYM